MARLDALPLPACGERVGVRGPLRRTQNRGDGPSPSLRSTSPGAGRGKIISFSRAQPRPSYANAVRKKDSPRSTIASRPRRAVGPAFGSIIAPQTKGKRNADRRIDPSSAPPPYYRITISEDRPGFFRTVYAARPRLHFTFRCPPQPPVCRGTPLSEAERVTGAGALTPCSRIKRLRWRDTTPTARRMSVSPTMARGRRWQSNASLWAA